MKHSGERISGYYTLNIYYILWVFDTENRRLWRGGWWQADNSEQYNNKKRRAAARRWKRRFSWCPIGTNCWKGGDVGSSPADSARALATLLIDTSAAERPTSPTTSLLLPLSNSLLPLSFLFYLTMHISSVPLHLLLWGCGLYPLLFIFSTSPGEEKWREMKRPRERQKDSIIYRESERHKLLNVGDKCCYVQGGGGCGWAGVSFSLSLLFSLTFSISLPQHHTLISTLLALICQRFSCLCIYKVD